MASNLGSFAFKRATLSAVVAGTINLVIVYFVLGGDGEVPLFASIAELWNHSLIGALLPRSLVISFLVTVATFLATVREVSKRRAGSVGKLEQKPWIKIALRKALARALIAFVIVIGLALVLRMLFPTYSVLPVSIVIPLVAIFAAIVAFSMTYSAVFTTGKLLESQD